MFEIYTHASSFTVINYLGFCAFKVQRKSEVHILAYNNQ